MVSFLVLPVNQSLFNKKKLFTTKKTKDIVNEKETKKKRFAKYAFFELKINVRADRKGITSRAEPS